MLPCPCGSAYTREAAIAASKQAPATALARSFLFRLFFFFTDENSSTKIEKVVLVAASVYRRR
jgi:hypothetical protein